MLVARRANPVVKISVFCHVPVQNFVNFVIRIHAVIQEIHHGIDACGSTLICKQLIAQRTGGTDCNHLLPRILILLYRSPKAVKVFSGSQIPRTDFIGIYHIQSNLLQPFFNGINAALRQIRFLPFALRFHFSCS